MPPLWCRSARSQACRSEKAPGTIVLHVFAVRTQLRPHRPSVSNDQRHPGPCNVSQLTREGKREAEGRPNDLDGVQLLVLHRRQKRGGGHAERGIAPAEPKRRITASPKELRRRDRTEAAARGSGVRQREARPHLAQDRGRLSLPRRFRARGRPKNPTRTTSGARWVQNFLELSREQPTERSEGG